MNGNIIKIWKSIMDAEREGGFDHGAIVNCCKGKTTKHHGYRWIYLSDYEKLYNKDGALF